MIRPLRHRRANYVWEFDALARYNAEVARGIVHTPEWCARMEQEQRRFDALTGRRGWRGADVQPAAEDAGQPVEGERSSAH